MKITVWKVVQIFAVVIMLFDRLCCQGRDIQSVKNVLIYLTLNSVVHSPLRLSLAASRPSF